MIPIVRCKEHHEQKHQYINICDMNTTGQVRPSHDCLIFPSFMSRHRPPCKHTVKSTNKFRSLNHTLSSGKPNASTKFSSEIIIISHNLPITLSLTDIHTPHLRHPYIPSPPQQIQTRQVRRWLRGAANARHRIRRSCMLWDQDSCVIGVGLRRSCRRTLIRPRVCYDGTTIRSP